MPEGNVAMVRSREVPASTFSGYLMLLIWLALLGWTIWALLLFGRAISLGDPAAPWVAGWIGGLLAFLLVGFGFYMIQPNQSAVITLFGAYRGTDRTEGLRWIWFWMGRKKISVRQNNVHSERVKVNDLR